MKKSIFAMMVLMSVNAFAWDAPEILEDACYEGCTPKMESLYNEFLATPNPLSVYPGMYSGECNYISGSLDPVTNHYAGMLFNTDDKGAYMTGSLQFFGDGRELAKMSFEDAKAKFLPQWKGGGRLTFNKTSTTTYFLAADNNPAIVYWARQNLATKDILFLIYNRNFSVGFCRLKLNTNGLP